MADVLDEKVFDLIEGGKKLDLFKPTTTVAESTKPHKPGKGITSESIHNALMAAGMTPGVGIMADAADAVLYALEGEFGDAALSSTAAIPIIGQFVSTKKALKAAKEAGEEMVTIYRGVDKWYPGSMVKDRKFISGPGTGVKTKTKMLHQAGGDDLFVTQDKKLATQYATRVRGGFPVIGAAKTTGDEILLEFEVPKSWMKKHFTTINPYYLSHKAKPSLTRKQSENYKMFDQPETGFFKGGLPVNFLKKVHKDLKMADFYFG